MKFAKFAGVTTVYAAVSVAAMLVAGTAAASTGALIEVIQPMLYGETSAIALHPVTFTADSYIGPGQEIDYIDQPNAMLDHGVTINTNVTSLFGIEVRVDRAGVSDAQLSAEQERHWVDTLRVTVSLRRADSAHGSKLTDGLLGTNGLARVLAATEAAVFANARRSWPPVRFVRLEVIPQNAATSRIRVELIEPLPKPHTY